MKSYMDRDIIDFGDFFGRYFDHKISETTFSEEWVKFTKSYYDDYEYLKDYEKLIIVNTRIKLKTMKLILRVISHLDRLNKIYIISRSKK